MFLTYCAYFAAIISFAGMVHRIRRWFRLNLGQEARGKTIFQRFAGAVPALLQMLLRPRSLFKVARALIGDVILQLRILKQSPLRWVMHMALFYGMLLLLGMHTFDDQITSRIFPDYASTLNPFLFGRNLLGIMVLGGIVIAVVRRRLNPMLKQTRHRADDLLLILLSAVILTGVGLEATQIISSTLFDQMVEEYMGSDDAEEIAPLKTYWAVEYKVAFAPMPNVDDPDLMAQGRRLHQDFCADCHSRPQTAILSYPLALAITPLSQKIQQSGLEMGLWYAHYLISCLALALLPFSKLFHLVATPLSLVLRSLGPAESDLPVNRSTRRALALDACTHCGVCSQHCAVGPVFEVIANPAILPSEKIGQAAQFAAGSIDGPGKVALAEGSFICTSCGRCTRECPSGIDLADLWIASKEDLNHSGFSEPHGWMARNSAAQWLEALKTRPDIVAQNQPLRRPIVRLADKPDTFWACVQCSTCTNVCPVVALSQNPQRDLEWTPQQVMNLLRLQLKETAMGSRMVWDCVTCYKCQEHCPQGVRVADVLYELRNEAGRRLTPLHQDDMVPPDLSYDPGGKNNGYNEKT